MGQWQYFNEASGQSFIDDVLADHGTQRVEDRLRPRPHFLILIAWQIAQFLATNSKKWAEHNDLALNAPLHHSF